MTCHQLCLCPGQRQVLDEIGVGQAIFLMTGLPPFLRVKELRPRDRGDLTLGYDFCFFIYVQFNKSDTLCSCDDMKQKKRKMEKNNRTSDSARYLFYVALQVASHCH